MERILRPLSCASFQAKWYEWDSKANTIKIYPLLIDQRENCLSPLLSQYIRPLMIHLIVSYFGKQEAKYVCKTTPSHYVFFFAYVTICSVVQINPFWEQPIWYFILGSYTHARARAHAALLSLRGLRLALCEEKQELQCKCLSTTTPLKPWSPFSAKNKIKQETGPLK